MGHVLYPHADKPKEGSRTAPRRSATAPPTRFRSLSDPESLREFARNLREGIYITTRDGCILDANAAFLEMFGVESIEAFGDYGASALFVDPAHRVAQLAALERDGYVRECELTLRRPDGAHRTVVDTCYLIRDPDTDEAFIHGILFDITARKELESTLIEMSTRDALTGALNHRYLTAIDKRLAADPALACGCLFVDIDYFKIYNDRWGHREGDEVLCRMARFLTRYVRAEEPVIRVGGDEFLVLLHGATAVETEQVADRLRCEALQHAPVAFSLGWAAREEGEPLQRVIDRADKGMMAVRVMKRSSNPRQPAIIDDER
jgi:diguanylate cyclase (GGDEF)-like protein/PAS domain S-box-containing protein